MPLVLTAAYKTIMLDLKRPTLQQWVCRLYTNNFNPVFGMAIGNFTQATFQGYASKAISFPNAAVIQVNGKALITSVLITWTPTGVAVQNTVFGYYVTDPANATVYFAERNPAGGIIVGQDLSPFTVQLNITEDTDPV